MTWRYLCARGAPAEVDLPEGPAAQPAASQLNCIINVLVFENEHGQQREIEWTLAMQLLAEKKGYEPQDYALGLIGFDDRLCA